jgi:hypothetical protein
MVAFSFLRESNSVKGYKLNNEIEYHISMYPRTIYCRIDLPMELNLTKEQIKVLEQEILTCFDVSLSGTLQKLLT